MMFFSHRGSYWLSNYHESGHYDLHRTDPLANKDNAATYVCQQLPGVLYVTIGLGGYADSEEDIMKRIDEIVDEEEKISRNYIQQQIATEKVKTFETVAPKVSSVTIKPSLNQHQD
jgi:hypothetical protein